VNYAAFKVLGLSSAVFICVFFKDPISNSDYMATNRAVIGD
jgi:hypothetical protein